MGEAEYYLKARFESEEKLKELYPKIKEFMYQGAASYDWWQENRGMQCDKFWVEFKKKFPMVYTYLGDLKNKDCNNGLAGSLDFGSKEDVDFNLSMNGDVLTYYATVWHFASWYLLKEAILKIGAIRAGWISDEDIDPFDLLGYV